MQYLVLSYNAEGWMICRPGVEMIDGIPTPCWSRDEEGFPYHCGTADVEMAMALTHEMDAVFPKAERDRLNGRIAELVEKYDEQVMKYEAESERSICLSDDISKLLISAADGRRDIELMARSMQHLAVMLIRKIDKGPVATTDSDPVVTAGENLARLGITIDDEISVFLSEKIDYPYRYSDPLLTVLDADKAHREHDLKKERKLPLDQEIPF